MVWKADDLIDQIRDVANRLGVPVASLTRGRFCAESGVGNYALERLGGWGALRATAARGRDDPPDFAESRRIQRSRIYASNIERRLGDTEYFFRSLQLAITAKLEELPPRATQAAPPIKYAPTRRALVALISDTHFGLSIDDKEVPGNRFGWHIAARRMGKLVSQIATWKPERREETELHLALGGDLIQGVLRPLEEGDGADSLACQIVGAADLITQAVDYLRGHFRIIKTYWTPGNHGRAPHRHRDRAAKAKWDSFETLVAHQVMASFRGLDGVSFAIPRTPYVTWELPGGHLVYLTHGDTVTPTGNVGRRLDIDKISRHVYALDASRVLDKPISVACFGHVHVPVNTVLQNGCELVVNGTLSGVDPYAQSIGIHCAPATQVLWESSERYPVGDWRKVYLQDADACQEYDDIISAPMLAAA